MPTVPQPSRIATTDATARNSYEMKMRAIGNLRFGDALMNANLAPSLFRDGFVERVQVFRREVVIRVEKRVAVARHPRSHLIPHHEEQLVQFGLMPSLPEGT